jgi:pyrroloquinoline quinone biosynthesis protein B
MVKFFIIGVMLVVAMVEVRAASVCIAARSCGSASCGYTTTCGSAHDTTRAPYLIVLGTLQDGGSPHLGCTKACCAKADPDKKVVSLGIADPVSGKRFLLEATPDIASQMALLNASIPGSGGKAPDGVFITHAHIGHYAGLMQLGREAMNANQVPVYAMPRMKSYLENNGPWSQLVNLNNIRLNLLSDHVPQAVTQEITITPLKVPHRDEFSETIGMLIRGPHSKILFIPDIDKWSKWGQELSGLIREVDVALLDATFFSNAEVGYRNIQEIPHPLVTETMLLLDGLSEKERSKVQFIHLNHTNPLLVKDSPERNLVLAKGYGIANIGMRIPL